MRLALLPAALLALACAAAPARAAEFGGSLVMSGQSDGAHSPVSNGTLEFNLAGAAASLNGRISGVHQKDAGSGKMEFDATEALLEFRSPHADLSAGDISPSFSDYTLSSPALEDGAELNLKAAGFSLKPVYLQLAKADQTSAVYARKLVGASLTKEDLPFGFSLGVAAYRASDDEGSLQGTQLKRPEEVTTLGVKAEYKAPSALTAFYEFSRSGADADTADQAGASHDQAFKGGLAIDWDRWDIAARYSRCDKDYKAAGVDAVDNDQGKFSADLSYSFSDYMNARVSESRITDGLSKGKDSQVEKQSSLFSVGFALPGLPALSLDYTASRNKNRLLLVNDEMQDYGYSANYSFKGLTAMANGRLSKSRDFTLQSDPSLTVSHNLGLSVPAKLLAAFTLTPNYAYTGSENRRTKARTYSETLTMAVSVSALAGKVGLNVSGSRSRNYDNTGAADTETRSLSSQLALNLSEAVKFSVGATASTTKDEVNPASSSATRQYSASTTITF